MENKKAAILILAIVAAVIVTASGAYAMGRQTTTQTSSYSGATYPSGMGPGMMGTFGGQANHHGMMGGYGMMSNGASPCWCPEYAEHYLNSTSAP